ncbi:hypothetical protein ID854_01790 [Xenorhabdus sp. M]|uniref:Uncharacterized protein n=1 Tax=Xenorhabdus szentirmaii TaxID=290112 RepID=A0AAW3YMH8_9GAMM|nr:hypothetical protein [Xenorhabdus sp. M]MBD2799225.1 hypothetical protein [Xenorhabdus sp. M]
MNNIYKRLNVGNDRISEMSDGDLNFLSSSSEDVIYSITKGLSALGNLTHAATNSEEYSQDDAMTDLEKIAQILPVLSLIIEAEYENHFNVIMEKQKRRQIKKEN